MKKVIFGFLTVIIISVLILTSCNNDNNLEKYREYELELLADFVGRYEIEHDVEISPTYSGLYYIEVEQGEGDTIVIGDKVQLWYNTYLLKDTSLVDTNMKDGHKYNPLEFIANIQDKSTVIEGLNEAVKYMQPGGKAFLIIPSELAYGQNGSGSVSGFNSLLMDIEIYKVYPASEGY